MSRVVIVGYDVEGHVGRHFVEAAKQIKLPHWVVSPAAAFEASRIVARFNWIARGHRPTRLQHFAKRVVERCRDVEATHLITTGIAPMTRAALDELRALGVRCVNWLTDDPWSRANQAPWFVQAVAAYDVVYTPRHTVTDDLRKAGVADIRYLPFAYCEQCHFPVNSEARNTLNFVGGGDATRLPYMNALIEAGVPIELYGGYWSDFRTTRAFARGFVDMAAYREVVAATTATVGLVRAHNRDQHVMRSYEVPAMRGLLLAQDTPDHRAMFGADGVAVRYFSSPADLARVGREVLADAEASRRISQVGHALITRPGNTYKDRLWTILEG